MSDYRGPHRYPQSLIDDAPGEVLMWKCAACGEWIEERFPYPNDCPYDWRNR